MARHPGGPAERRMCGVLPVQGQSFPLFTATQVHKVHLHSVRAATYLCVAARACTAGWMTRRQTPCLCASACVHRHG